MAKLNSVVVALIAGDIAALNASFASVSMEDMKTVRNNFNDFYSKFKAANEAAEAAAKERKAQIETETKELVDALVAAGLDLEMAAEVASQKMAVKYPELAPKSATGKTWSFETVFVNVDGEKLEIGTKLQTQLDARPRSASRATETQIENDDLAAAVASALLVDDPVFGKVKPPVK